MNKLSAIWNLFRKGEAVANPAIYKDAQNAGLIIGGLIMAMLNLAAAFGHPLPGNFSVDSANAVGLGIATIVGFVFNNITSKHAGVLPAREPVPGPAASGEARPAPVQPVHRPAPEVVRNADIGDDVRQRAEDFIRRTHGPGSGG